MRSCGRGESLAYEYALICGSGCEPHMRFILISNMVLLSLQELNARILLNCVRSHGWAIP